MSCGQKNVDIDEEKDILTSQIVTCLSPRVPEGLQDPSVQAAAAGRLEVSLSRGWALAALEQPLQQGELHQGQQLQQGPLLPNLLHH